MPINLKKFYVLRYSLVKNEQDSLLTNNLPEPKGRAIEISLNSGDTEWIDKNVKFSFVGFTNLEIPSSHENLEFFFGKLARLNHVKIGEKIPRDIIELKQDDWNSVYVIFEIVNQLVFVQKKSKFDNGNVTYVCKKLETGLNQSILPFYNYKLFIEPINVRGTFWTEVNKHSKIYELDLKLISPNILETNQKARDALESLKTLFHQEETEIKLKNSQGNLEIPKDPIDNYIDYIEEGEGEWKLEVEENGKKKKISNMSLVDTVELPINDSFNNATGTNDSTQYDMDIKTKDNLTLDKINMIDKLLNI